MNEVYSKQQITFLLLTFSHMTYLLDRQKLKTEIRYKDISQNIDTPYSDMLGNCCFTNSLIKTQVHNIMPVNLYEPRRQN